MNWMKIQKANLWKILTYTFFCLYELFLKSRGNKTISNPLRFWLMMCFPLISEKVFLFFHVMVLFSEKRWVGSGSLKTSIFSQGILEKESKTAGSCEDNNALLILFLGNYNFLWYLAFWYLAFWYLAFWYLAWYP